MKKCVLYWKLINIYLMEITKMIIELILDSLNGWFSIVSGRANTRPMPTDPRTEGILLFCATMNKFEFIDRMRFHSCSFFSFFFFLYSGTFSHSVGTVEYTTRKQDGPTQRGTNAHVSHGSFCASRTFY